MFLYNKEMKYSCTVDNDNHRASKMKQPHVNNTKKQKKAKGNHVTTQEEQSAQIFRSMQEEVRNRLTCCAPGAELEVNRYF